jgi:hypothetical protein
LILADHEWFREQSSRRETPGGGQSIRAIIGRICKAIPDAPG